MVLLAALAVAAAAPGVARASQERRLGAGRLGAGRGAGGRALHVLTHEAMHLSGRLGEAGAECAAVQRDARTARRVDGRAAGRRPLACAAGALDVRYGGAGIHLGRSVVMLGAVLLGLIAGLVARMLVPGDVLRNMSGPTSWLASIALGLAGAILGYLIFTVGLGIGDTDMFDFGGLISAIIGTVIVLVVVGFFVRRRGTPRV